MSEKVREIQDAMSKHIRGRVKDYFEVKIDSQKNAEDQKHIAEIAREVIAVIDQS